MNAWMGRVCCGALVVALAPGCERAARDQPRVQYDPQSGRLQRLEYDANGNGRNDAVSIMDGTRVHWIELDLDENGKVDRWDVYGPDNILQKVGFSRHNDGIPDAEAFYRPDGTLERIQLSTRRDGRFDRVEFYELGVLVRSEEDGDRDGRADKWETYQQRPDAPPGEPPYFITSAAFDDVGRGTPRRRFVYGPHGEVQRVEVDADGDGVFLAVRLPYQSRNE